MLTIFYIIYSPPGIQDPPKLSLLRRGYNWFCGIDDTPEGLRKAEEQSARIKKITSLSQDPRARLGLFIGLVVLCTLDVFLYIFFSTGSDFGLLS